MSLLQELHPHAVRIAAALRERGQRIAVADGATGGLVMAALLTVPGALDFFKGGASSIPSKRATFCLTFRARLMRE
ncbi:MAG: CinA family protein [Pseudomonadota bacterium]